MTIAGLPVAAAVAALLIPAGSSASDPVGGNQTYQGEVNHSQWEASLTVVCPPGALIGYVKSAQTVAVVHDPSPTAPRTGALDTKIVAYMENDPLHTVSIFSYGTPVAIPTNWEAPCSGTGYVAFKPGTGGGGVTDRVLVIITAVAS